MQHKFHAAICFFLGFIALNGIIEGAVTRFEIELLFIGLALIMMLLWMILPRKIGLINDAYKTRNIPFGNYVCSIF